MHPITPHHGNVRLRVQTAQRARTWKPARLLGVLLLPLLTSCATSGMGARVLTTPDQQERYAQDVAAGQRVCDTIDRTIYPTSDCPLTRIEVREQLPPGTAGGALPNGLIVMHKRLYAGDTEELRRAILAHEFAHQLLNHPRRCREAKYRPLCEQQADIHSVRVLELGWGMSQAEAVKLVYARLLGRAGHMPRNGHAAGCDEILAFTIIYRLPVPAGC